MLFVCYIKTGSYVTYTIRDLLEGVVPSLYNPTSLTAFILVSDVEVFTSCFSVSKIVVCTRCILSRLLLEK